MRDETLGLDLRLRQVVRLHMDPGSRPGEGLSQLLGALVRDCESLQGQCVRHEASGAQLEADLAEFDGIVASRLEAANQLTFTSDERRTEFLRLLNRTKERTKALHDALEHRFTFGDDDQSDYRASEDEEDQAAELDSGSAAALASTTAGSAPALVSSLQSAPDGAGGPTRKKQKKRATNVYDLL